MLCQNSKLITLNYFATKMDKFIFASLISQSYEYKQEKLNPFIMSTETRCCSCYKK